MSIVRPAEPKDADAAIDVVRRSISQLCVADHHHHDETLALWLENKTPRNFLAWISSVDNFCVVAEANGVLSGVGVLQRRGEILLFYLAPGAQRQGIGRMMHDALERQAVRWGLTSLHLESTAMACAFYRALGYRPAGAPITKFGILQCFPYAKHLQSGFEHRDGLR